MQQRSTYLTGRTFGRAISCAAASALLVVAAGASPAAAPAPSPELTGDCFIHDPSTVVRCKKEYWVFGTGPGIISLHSPDLATWHRGPQVFPGPLPDWIKKAVPGSSEWVWAPDVLYRNHRYQVYYAVSTFGHNTSVIGLATSPTLDPNDRAYHWTDEGLVVGSTSRDNYNAIDPCPFPDPHGGRLWLTFGSFWSGIKLVELNPKTGKRLSDDTPIYSIATHPPSTAIEAPYLYYRNGYYYLFVNWDLCCRGASSTYNIRVGRSRTVTGPYLDRQGVDMARGGGTLFLAGSGYKAGPGCIGILRDRNGERFSYHYYDTRANGRPTLDLRPLSWTADGWPVASGASADGAAASAGHPFPSKQG